MRLRRRSTAERGQGLVEFALSITIFLLLLMGTVDLARVVYAYNGVSEAAREISRATSVHPGSTLGTSTETAAALATQQRIIPDLSVVSYACVDLAGVAVTSTCQPGDWVRVTVRSTLRPITPVLSALGGVAITAASSAQIE